MRRRPVGPVSDEYSTPSLPAVRPVFGTSGVRGPVGGTVTGTLARDLGRALGSMTDAVVVGRDARESGDALARAAVAGVQEVGSDVVDLGVEPTPTATGNGPPPP
jgi:phosphomannomutase